ncbi:MAG: acyl carrier protein [Candidatus Moraniibacteriota bacterium]|jgi:acyl carrier protein
MNKDKLQNKVVGIISEHLSVDIPKITLDANFIDDLGADSLDAVEMVMAFEEDFNIEIPDEDAEKITTLRKALDYIEKKMQ